MGIELAAILTVAVVFFVAGLVAVLLGETRRERQVSFMITLVYMTNFAVFGWLVYVVGHFLGKYW